MNALFFIILIILLVMIYCCLLGLRNLREDVQKLSMKIKTSTSTRSQKTLAPSLQNLRIDEPQRSTKIETATSRKPQEALAPCPHIPSLPLIQVHECISKPAPSACTQTRQPAHASPSASTCPISPANTSVKPCPTAQPTTKSKKTVEPKGSDLFDFEKLMLGNIFNKLGALALIIGLAIFIMLLSPMIVFTPLRQVILVYLLGFGLCITSWKIHSKDMKSFAEVLMGTGFAIFFVATYGATSYYHLMPELVAIITGALLVIASYLISLRYKNFSTMAIGMLAAYINPIIIAPQQSIEMLFGYFIFINAITAAYTLKNDSKYILNIINLLATTLYVVVFASYSGLDISYIFPALLWGLYTGYDFLSKKACYKIHNWALAILNYLVLIYFTIDIFGYVAEQQLRLSLIISAVGALYILLAYLNRTKDAIMSALHASSGILALIFATSLIEHDSLRIILWALQGLSCALLVWRWKISYLVYWSLTIMLLASVAALLHINQSSELIPLWNLRTLELGLVAISGFACSLLLLKANINISRLLLLASIVMSYILIVCEINAGVAASNIISGVNLAMLYTLIALSFALLSLKLYKGTEFLLFAIAGYAVLAISYFALIFYSCSALAMMPILNFGFIAFAIAIFGAWQQSRTLPTDAAMFFKITCIALGFALTHKECHNICQNLEPQTQAICSSISWIVYSAALMTMGIIKGNSLLKISGIILIIIASAKIIFIDLSETEPLLRTIAFLLLGSVMMLLSYFYTKKLKDEPKK